MAQNDTFYDAFGGKIGKVEEIWAGDSFNRDTIMAYACADTITAKSCVNSAEPATLSLIVNNCDWNADDLASSIGAVNNTYNCDYAVKTDVSTSADSIANLQKQIDELRDKVKVQVASKLRSELRTLRYIREVV